MTRNEIIQKARGKYVWLKGKAKKSPVSQAVLLSKRYIMYLRRSARYIKYSLRVVCEHNSPIEGNSIVLYVHVYRDHARAVNILPHLDLSASTMYNTLAFL